MDRSRCIANRMEFNNTYVPSCINYIQVCVTANVRTMTNYVNIIHISRITLINIQHSDDSNRLVL